MTETAKPKLPRFKRARDNKPVILLQPRDKDIIKALYDHRFLTSEQIRALIPAHYQSMARRLKKLYHNGYLDRLKGSLVEPIIYALGDKGADILTLHFGIDRGKINWQKKNKEVGEYYKDHILMIANFRITLTLALKEHPQTKLVDWQTETQLKETLKTKKQKRPALIPDAFFTIEHKGYWAYFFLEADQSTMTNKRFLDKMKAYWRFNRENQHKKLNIESFRVLTITKSVQRKENLRHITKQADTRQSGSQMFWFASETDYNYKDPQTILKPIWQTSKDNQCRQIINLN